MPTRQSIKQGVDNAHQASVDTGHDLWENSPNRAAPFGLPKVKMLLMLRLIEDTPMKDSAKRSLVDGRIYSDASHHTHVTTPNVGVRSRAAAFLEQPDEIRTAMVDAELLPFRRQSMAETLFDRDISARRRGIPLTQLVDQP